jgi:hypothetical protein
MNVGERLSGLACKRNLGHGVDAGGRRVYAARARRAVCATIDESETAMMTDEGSTQP